jgi:transposase
MLHAGLDLSRRKVDVCLLSTQGEIVDEWASPPDADGLRGLAARAAMWGPVVRGVIESMNGARFVHDRLEEHGWDVLIADATKVKGLAPLSCKTDRIDARVLATLSARDLVPEIWLPDPSIRRERELARFRLHLVRHRTTLKNRIHAALIAFGQSVPGVGSAATRHRCRRLTPASITERTTLGHDRRSRCRGQAGVPVSADETTAWDEGRSFRGARCRLAGRSVC